MRDHLADLAGGTAGASVDARAEAHARGCAACEALLRRSKTVARALHALATPVPPVRLIPPTLPPESPAASPAVTPVARPAAEAARPRPWRSALVRVAAPIAAAAMLAVTGWVAARHSVPTEWRYIDVAGAHPDDRFLALQAGPEAVAARWPAAVATDIR